MRVPAPQGSRALAAEMRASCFGTPVRAEDTRKARGQTARARPERGSRAPRSKDPPSGRPLARGARAEAPTCRQRAPKMDSSRPTRRKRLARAAGSSRCPHLDLGRGNRGGSAAVGARACSPGLPPPSDRHRQRIAISATRKEPKFSKVVQTAITCSPGVYVYGLNLPVCTPPDGRKAMLRRKAVDGAASSAAGRCGKRPQ